MRAKLVNEAIKHLTAREFSTEDNLERALHEFDNARTQFSDRDRENVIMIIKTLTKLDFIVFFTYSWLTTAFSIILNDYNHKYTKPFSGYYLPEPYSVGPGIELTERGAILNRNAEYLRPTMDMKKVKEFLEKFKK